MQYPFFQGLYFERVSYTCAVDLHFKFIKVKPVLGFLRIQVVVEVSGCKPKTVEPQFGRQEQARWALLVGHTGVPTLPASEMVWTPASDVIIH